MKILSCMRKKLDIQKKKIIRQHRFSFAFVIQSGEIICFKLLHCIKAVKVSVPPSPDMEQIVFSLFVFSQIFIFFHFRIISCMHCIHIVVNRGKHIPSTGSLIHTFVTVPSTPLRHYHSLTRCMHICVVRVMLLANEPIHKRFKH